MSKAAFLQWLEGSSVLRCEPIERLFHAMRAEGSQYLVQEDFQHFMKLVLRGHPGLEFLAETPEFQERCERKAEAPLPPVLSLSLSLAASRQDGAKLSCRAYLILPSMLEGCRGECSAL